MSFEELVQLILVILIFGGAALWKVIVKLLGSSSTVKTLTEVGKHGKTILETLTGEEFVDPKKRREEERRATQEGPVVAERGQTVATVEQPREAAPLPPSSLDEARMSPLQRLEERLRQYAEERMKQPQEPPVAQPVVRAEPKKRRPKPKPAPPPKKAAPKKPEPRKAGPAPPPPMAGGLLGNLRHGRPEALREAIVLREILGPPKAMAGAYGGGGYRGSLGGMIPPPPPPPAPAAKAGGVPQRINEMYELGMLTRDQYEDLCRHFES